jgi:GT2 family glycosyltransferase
MKTYKFGINVTTYNRYKYLLSTLESLKKTIFLPDTVLIITDDNSQEQDTINYLKNYNIENENIKIRKIFNESNLGSKDNYHKSLLSFIDEDVDFIVNIDSDCLLNKQWLLKINELINEFDDNIICSSFCCKYHFGNPNNKLEIIKEKYYERDTLNGMGICFPKKILHEFYNHSPLHFDGYLCHDLKNRYKMRCICTSISYMQHIGAYGVHSNPHAYDCSDNFIGEN